MGARSDVHAVAQPWPVVFDALQRCLPTAGFRIRGVDEARGRLQLRARNADVVVAVGAVDAITSAWVATSEHRIALGPPRHRELFAAISESLDHYLAAYYA